MLCLFALAPGDCVSLTGIDRDNQPGLRREFPQASWLVEAANFSDEQSHLNPSHYEDLDKDKDKK
jgi:hypothetical protein